MGEPVRDQRCAGVVFADGQPDGHPPAAGSPVWVEARIAEYMYGDSCVLIETGDRGRLSRFYVPTKRIHLRKPPALTDFPASALREVPEYSIQDALSAYWDLRSGFAPR